MIRLAWMMCVAAGVVAAAEHVVVIGIDGLAAEAVRNAKSPVFRDLMARGSWTLHARGVLPTVSSPNWASMIMGAGPEQHGVDSNDWQLDKHAIAPVCQGSGGMFPTMFGVVRAERPAAKIAVIHDWEGFGRLVERSAPSLMRHVKGSGAATEAALDVWKRDKPALLFLHLDDVDHAGHDHGWFGTEYTAAVEEIAGYVGRVVEAVKGTPGTVVLVTADHGGNGKRHGSPTMQELLIPWIAAGSGVPVGEIRGPVNTYDTAATVAGWLGVPGHPCWIGRDRFITVPNR